MAFLLLTDQKRWLLFWSLRLLWLFPASFWNAEFAQQQRNLCCGEMITSARAAQDGIRAVFINPDDPM